MPADVARRARGRQALRLRGSRPAARPALRSLRQRPRPTRPCLVRCGAIQSPADLPAPCAHRTAPAHHRAPGRPAAHCSTLAAHDPIGPARGDRLHSPIHGVATRAEGARRARGRQALRLRGSRPAARAALRSLRQRPRPTRPCLVRCGAIQSPADLPAPCALRTAPAHHRARSPRGHRSTDPIGPPAAIVSTPRSTGWRHAPRAHGAAGGNRAVGDWIAPSRRDRAARGAEDPKEARAARAAGRDPRSRRPCCPPPRRAQPQSPSLATPPEPPSARSPRTPTARRPRASPRGSCRRTS